MRHTPSVPCSVPFQFAAAYRTRGEGNRCDPPPMKGLCYSFAFAAEPFYCHTYNLGTSERLFGILHPHGHIIGRIFLQQQFQRGHPFFGRKPPCHAALQDNAFICCSELVRYDVRLAYNAKRCFRQEVNTCQFLSFPGAMEIYPVGTVPYKTYGDTVRRTLRRYKRHNAELPVSQQVNRPAFIEQPVLASYIIVTIQHNPFKIRKRQITM